MALEIIKNVSVGSREINAGQFNAMARIAQRDELEQTNNPSASNPTAKRVPSLTVIVYNSTANDRTAGDILKVTDALAEFPDLMREAADHPVLNGALPGSTSDIVAILLEPIGTLGYGKAALLGVATCTVNVTDATHQYATPTASDATKLTSATVGPIRLLNDPTTTGDQDAMVMLQSWPATTPTGTPAFARITGGTTNKNIGTVATPLYPAILVSLTAPNTWTDGASTVYVKETSGPYPSDTVSRYVVEYAGQTDDGFAYYLGVSGANKVSSDYLAGVVDTGTQELKGNKLIRGDVTLRMTGISDSRKLSILSDAADEQIALYTAGGASSLDLTGDSPTTGIAQVSLRSGVGTEVDPGFCYCALGAGNDFGNLYISGYTGGSAQITMAVNNGVSAPSIVFTTLDGAILKQNGSNTFTGTLADAITGGKSVVNGLIMD